MSFWEWLSGKKMAIGAVVLAIVTNGFIPDDLVVFGFLNLYQALLWLGNTLVGVGAVHKGVKAVAKK